MVNQRQLKEMQNDIDKADKLIEDQIDNIKFLEETDEDASQVKADLEIIRKKRDLIVAAINRRVDNAAEEPESE